MSDGRLDRGADFHLRNWAQWMKGYEVGIGYGNKSAVVQSPTSSSFDEMVYRMDRQNAKIANAIIDSMTPVQQGSIHNVYLASVWRFRGDPIDVFVGAAAKFWEMAQRRGLS
jgi:hypothetical protein